MKTILRSEFDKLDAIARFEHCRAGGKVVDTLTTDPKAIPLCDNDKKTFNRALFEVAHTEAVRLLLADGYRCVD